MILPDRFDDPREAAQLISAAEFSQIEHQIEPTSDDSNNENAPIYALTPTGGAMNRVVIAGTLTEVTDTQEDSDDQYMRARVVGPTGKTFFVYAGQFEEEALAFLNDADAPMHVMCTGKINLYDPDDSDDVYPQVRPEWMTSISAAERDLWTIEMAHQTMDRIEITARDDEEMPNYVNMDNPNVPDQVPEGVFHAKEIPIGEASVKKYLDDVIEALEEVDEAQAADEAGVRSTVDTPSPIKAEA